MDKKHNLPLTGGLVTSRFKARYYTFATRLERLVEPVCASTEPSTMETTLDGMRVVVEFDRAA